MAINAKKVVVRQGVAAQIPRLIYGEVGWDTDYKRLRVGDDSISPTMIMTNKSTGPFQYNNIDYVQYPQIRMLENGTVDGVDISRLNAQNGILVRRGNNQWGHRLVENTDGYISIQNPAGTGGNIILNVSNTLLDLLNDYLREVAVDGITIHGNGRPENPLYAQQGDTVNKGAVRFATDIETYEGNIPNAAIAPSSLRYAATSSPPSMYANTSRSGFIRLSTQDETMWPNVHGDGYGTNVAVSPAVLYDVLISKSRNFNWYATDIRSGVVELATWLETFDGVNTDNVITPDSLRRTAIGSPPAMYANTSRSGFIRLATLAETMDANINGDGVGANVAMSPHMLRNTLVLKSRNENWYATTTRSGVVELATEAETLAGVNEENVLTPFLLKRYFEENASGGIYQDTRMTTIDTLTGNGLQGTFNVSLITFPYFGTATLRNYDDDTILRIISGSTNIPMIFSYGVNIQAAIAFTIHKGNLYLMDRYYQPLNTVTDSAGDPTELNHFPASFSPNAGTTISATNWNNSFIGSSFSPIISNYSPTTITLGVTGTDWSDTRVYSTIHRWRRDYL